MALPRSGDGVCRRRTWRRRLRRFGWPTSLRLIDYKWGALVEEWRGPTSPSRQTETGTDDGIVALRVTACHGKLRLERVVEIGCARSGVEVWLVMVHCLLVVLVASLTSGEDLGKRRSAKVDNVPVACEWELKPGEPSCSDFAP